MSVTIRARLPKGDTNGLAHLEAALADDPDRVVTVVAYVQTDTVEDRPHDADNPRQVKTVLLHVEALTDGDGDAAATLLRAAYQERTGKAELPLYGALDDAGDA